jgi:hypothetical protein
MEDELRYYKRKNLVLGGADVRQEKLDKALQVYLNAQEEKEAKREEAECARIVGMLENKHLSDLEASRESCLSKKERSQHKPPEEKVIRCESPRLLDTCADQDKACQTSEFFRHNLETAETQENWNEIFQRHREYRDPRLQQLSELQDIEEMYELADSILFISGDACK